MKRDPQIETTGPAQLTNEAPRPPSLAPRSPSEKYLASLWSEIIGLDKLTLPEKFLDVGGNSLTLNIVLSRIKSERGVSLEAELFFDPERSSVAYLARELDVLIKTNPTRP